MTTDNRDNGRVWTVEEPQKTVSSVADYDKAVEATGYGLFNVLLFLAVLPVAWTCIIDTTSTAFIINSAECDFDLTMFRRGIAVATIYIGMIIAGPLWDFILQDCVIGYLGKKNLMTIGMFFDAICNILWAHATSFYMFILFKFISGIMIAGPLSVVMSYIAEFHAPSYQPKFTRWATLFVMAANIIPAALAATLLLRTPWFNFTIYNHFYPTWRIYLLICAIPSVLGLLTTCLMPRSPKFLLARGKTQEALKLFRTMYSMNNFKPSSQYPITELASEENIRSEISISCRDKLQDSVTKVKSLFFKPHLKTVLIILVLQFASMVGFNVMRLWVPPLFVMMNNFRVLIRPYYPAGSYITMCEMIFPSLQLIDHTSCNYTLPTVESAVYVNSTTIATTAVLSGFLFGLFFDTRIKRICVIMFTFLLSALGCFGANWAVEIPYMLILVAFVIVASRISGNTILKLNAELMPQLLRPTSINVINFIGNVGATAGNIIFSLILEVDCLSAFLSAGSIAAVCTILPIFLIKKSSKPAKADIERY